MGKALNHLNLSVIVDVAIENVKNHIARERR